MGYRRRGLLGRVAPLPLQTPPSGSIIPEQPHRCNGTRLMPGQESCCGNKSYALMTGACCGVITYDFRKLSCCEHGDGTATLYNPYAQNCCDDPAAKNVQRGICAMKHRQRSCC